MTGFKGPNHTQTPNELFDTHMKNMGEAELKVTLAVIRKTLGYHKEKDPISYTQIMKLTGLSRTSTQDGINKAVAHGYIEIAGKGKRGVNIFRLVVNPDQSTSTTSTSSEELPVTGSATLPTKEIENKPIKENTRKREPFYDAIASTFKLTASGQIVSIRSMMQGKATRGTWKDCNFSPPVTDAQEIIDFAAYMAKRMSEKRITEPITAAVTIQRWFYDFREAQAKASQPKTEKERWADIPELRGITEIIR